MRGKKPFRGNSLVRRQLRIAKEKAGIAGPVGWHSFRRCVSTWMIENNENLKVTQELLRHANSKKTLDPYAKAVTPSKRQAHERIVNQLLAAQQRVEGGIWFGNVVRGMNVGQVWVAFSDKIP